MYVVFTQHAEPGTVFAADAFDGQIGKRVPLRIDDVLHSDALEILAVEVSADGRSMAIKAAMSDELAEPIQRGAVAGLSITEQP